MKGLKPQFLLRRLSLLMLLVVASQLNVQAQSRRIARAASQITHMEIYQGGQTLVAKKVK